MRLDVDSQFVDHYLLSRNSFLNKQIVRHNDLMSMGPPDDWPFDQPRNCVTMTMRQVLDRSEPILLVAHNADDHSWQFIGSTDACEQDGRVVSLEEIVRLDPTVVEVADLPPGWEALRDDLGTIWVRR